MVTIKNKTKKNLISYTVFLFLFFYFNNLWAENNVLKRISIINKSPSIITLVHNTNDNELIDYKKDNDSTNSIIKKDSAYWLITEKKIITPNNKSVYHLHSKNSKFEIYKGEVVLSNLQEFTKNKICIIENSDNNDTMIRILYKKGVTSCKITARK